MLIRELFERDPTRTIHPIASVRQHDPAIVYEELNEYVVTEHIRSDLTEILDRFIESRTGRAEDVCCWITGFFGSGKSIFLKLLGYVLGNLSLDSKNEGKIDAGAFFLNKHGLEKYAPMLFKELKTTPVFINLLDLDVKEPGITRIIYTELLKISGFSKIPWIAEIERTLHSAGLWDVFLKFVEEKEGKSWESVRELILHARPTLVKALHELEPDRFPTLDDARKSVDDVERALEITPSFLVTRLLEKATEVGSEKGRIVILLDEAGQYLDRSERLAELNVLAEQFGKAGEGKLWLFVTAQEKLESVMDRVPHTKDIARIRDRFMIQIQLTPENIDTVTKKRMLQKKADPKILAPLKSLYRQHAGTLWASASLVAAQRDYGVLFEREENLFVESYPFMPYHIRLMQDIFDILRAGGVKVTGRERTILQAVSSIFAGIKERKGFADSVVGNLVTFDAVYDVLEEYLKAIAASEAAAIERISRLSKSGEVNVSSVAKLMFLIQNVEWLPCNIANISALLYPKLGDDKNALESSVQDCLEILKKGLWAAETQGTYRLLSEFERSFEQMVLQKNSDPDVNTKKRQLSVTVAEKLVKEQQKFNKFVYKSVPFDVYLKVDDTEVTSKGHIELRFYTPLQSGNEELIQRLKRNSIAEANVVYWFCEASPSYENFLERAVCVEKALGDYKPQSQSDKVIVEQHRTALSILKEDELPKALERAAQAGEIVFEGSSTSLDGRRNTQEIFRVVIEEAVSRVFPDFNQAPFRLEHDPKDINDILRWRGGALPTIFKDLQLVDEGNNIRTNTPASSRIIEYLKSRSPEERRGFELLQHFTSPPFGWEEGIVRLVLAALFVNRSISATSDKKYASAADSASHVIFTNSKIFLKTLFDLGGEVLKPEEREAALELLSEIFGKKARPTPDDIDAVMLPEVESRLVECKDLISKSQLVSLPVLNQLQQLEHTLGQVGHADTPIQRILVFISSCNKEERRNVLKSQLKLLKRLRDFDLTKYFSASRFAQDIAPQLASVLRNSEPQIDEHVDSIRHSLNAEDFLDRWPTITATWDKLKRLYKKTYGEQHLERHKSIQEAVKILEAHALLRKLTDTKKQNYLRPLLEIDCAFQPSLDDALVCEKCNATLASMAWNISIVGERRMQIESDLEKIENKGKRQTLVGFTETINKPSDISMIVKKVDQTARRAVSQGKSVKIKLEVD
jgi:hypothetical protein